jgi:hypothetical protein
VVKEAEPEAMSTCNPGARVTSARTWSPRDPVGWSWQWGWALLITLALDVSGLFVLAFNGWWTIRNAISAAKR